MALDRPLWKLKFQDPSWSEPRIYTFDPQTLLTVADLEKIQSWYGPEIGRYITFTNAFTQGDPGAARCALWLVRRAAGESGVPEPPQMPNFALGDFFHEFIPAGREDEEEDPTPASAQDPILESTETPASSDESISVSSPQSAD